MRNTALYNMDWIIRDDKSRPFGIAPSNYSDDKDGNKALILKGPFPIGLCSSSIVVGLMDYG
ncbi:MAG: hypothetical protein ABIR84_10400 [Candidatus Nitrotoga sp.]